MMNVDPQFEKSSVLPRRRFSWRRTFALIFALIGVIAIIFFCAFVYLIIDWRRHWDPEMEMRAHENCMTSEKMSDRLRHYPPFNTFPAPDAAHIICFDRTSGMNGYDTWTRFEFKTDEQFAAYMRTVTTHKDVTHDSTLTFDGKIPLLPPIFERLMVQDGETTGVRATWQGGNYKQWIFYPKHRRVIALCTD